MISKTPVSFSCHLRQKELGNIIDYLDSAEDGEAGEEPHGASDEPE